MRTSNFGLGLFRPLTLLLLGLAVACSDSDSPDAGPADTGPADTGVAPDTGPEDTGPVDLGPPPPCLFDQGGAANRGCDPGFVCNIESGECVEGRSCTSNMDCEVCHDLIPGRREPCGHGFSATAWCDPNHGNVCTRSRAPCEPCQSDSDCGFLHPIDRLSGDLENPGAMDRIGCVEYASGGSFCGRPSRVGCPRGFDTAGGQCVRAAGCAEEPVFCPRSETPGVGCAGREQICPGESCPDVNAPCATNDRPGSIGLCIGFCQNNADCPADRPICNRTNGLCGPGCTKDTCAGNQVCHVDGRCAPPCLTDEDCTANTPNNSRVYGTEEEVYCNLPDRPAPRYYKGGNRGYRDDNSCAPLGCEQAIDCGRDVVNVVCDLTSSPPECVPGCFSDTDCSRSVCKRGPQGEYSQEACRALARKPAGTDEIGVCCDPGCTNRELDCNINQFCCGEPGSPFEDEAMCPDLVLGGGVPAVGGQCFDLIQPPFCVSPGQGAPCNSGWTPGFNTEPDIQNGLPFQEQEFPFGVDTTGDGMADTPLCGVTCNPRAPDSGCPREWRCEPIVPGCCQDADCGGGGLTCVGANCGGMPANAGRCKCGEDGVGVACPTAYGGPGGGLGTVLNPRCRDPEGDDIGDMFCVASNNCRGPTIGDLYPAACFE